MIKAHHISVHTEDGEETNNMYSIVLYLMYLQVLNFNHLIFLSFNLMVSLFT